MSNVSNSKIIGIEYKHHKKGPVGVNSINQVLGASVIAGLGSATLVTKSRFSAGAREHI